MKILAKIIIVFLIGISLSQVSNAVELVTEADIKALKDKTEIFKLSNGIPVIYRQETSSDIIHLAVSFDWALKDQKVGQKRSQTL